MGLILAAALLAIVGATTLQVATASPRTTSTKLFIVDTPEIIRREYQAQNAKNIFGNTLEFYSYIDGEGKVQTINYAADRRQSINDAATNVPKATLDIGKQQLSTVKDTSAQEQLVRQAQLEALRDAQNEAELRKALQDNLRARAEQAREQEIAAQQREREKARAQELQQQQQEQERQRDNAAREQQVAEEAETRELLERARAELMAMLEESIQRENAAAIAAQPAGSNVERLNAERLRLSNEQRARLEKEARAQHLRLQNEERLRLESAQRLRLESDEREQRLRLAAAEREARLQQSSSANVENSERTTKSDVNLSVSNENVENILANAENNRLDDVRMTTYTLKKLEDNQRIVEPLSDLHTIYTLSGDSSNTYLKLGNIAERKSLNVNLEDEIRVPVNSYYTLVSPTTKYSVSTPTVLTTLPRLESIRLGNRLPISLSTSILKQRVPEPRS